VLRSSARRLLLYLDTELTRNQDQPVTIANDLLGIVGSRRVWQPAIHELHELGLLDVERTFKRHRVGRSERWRLITSLAKAEMVSAAARAVGGAPIMCAAHFQARAS
jgi:hypothetical protein